MCELLEDGAQLHDGGLDVLHRVRPALDVGILWGGPGVDSGAPKSFKSLFFGLVFFFSHAHLLIQELELLVCPAVHLDGHGPGALGLVLEHGRAAWGGQGAVRGAWGGERAPKIPLFPPGIPGLTEVVGGQGGDGGAGEMFPTAPLLLQVLGGKRGRKWGEKEKKMGRKWGENEGGK